MKMVEEVEKSFTKSKREIVRRERLIEIQRRESEGLGERESERGVGRESERVGKRWVRLRERERDWESESERIREYKTQIKVFKA